MTFFKFQLEYFCNQAELHATLDHCACIWVNLKSDKIPSIHDKDLAVPVTYVVARSHNRLERDSTWIAGASQARFDNPEQLLRPHQIALNTFIQVRSFVVNSLPLLSHVTVLYLSKGYSK